MSDTIAVTESVVEEVVLNHFEGLGYSVLNGLAIPPPRLPLPSGPGSPT